MTSERLGNIDLRAGFTNRLYKLKPRASGSKGASKQTVVGYAKSTLPVYDHFNKHP